MNPEERRAAMVTATRTVMARRGIAGTTVRDVAAQLGTSSGLIHHYYASMDELLAEAFEQVAREDLERVRGAVNVVDDAIGRLRTFFDIYARDEDQGIQVWLDAWSEAARRPALQRISRRLNEEWQALLASIIGQGVTDGSMACDDVDAVSWRILSLLDGLALQVVAHGDVISLGEADAWSRAGAERELGLRSG
ncbi:MAG: TetR/AcrR family transcriptional regulator, partial [Candidatus Nanopelagicales bacterium]